MEAPIYGLWISVGFKRTNYCPGWFVLKTGEVFHTQSHAVAVAQFHCITGKEARPRNQEAAGIEVREISQITGLPKEHK